MSEDDTVGAPFHPASETPQQEDRPATEAEARAVCEALAIKTVRQFLAGFEIGTFGLMLLSCRSQPCPQEVQHKTSLIPFQSDGQNEERITLALLDKRPAWYIGHSVYVSREKSGNTAHTAIVVDLRSPEGLVARFMHEIGPDGNVNTPDEIPAGIPYFSRAWPREASTAPRFDLDRYLGVIHPLLLAIQGEWEKTQQLPPSLMLALGSQERLKWLGVEIAAGGDAFLPNPLEPLDPEIPAMSLQMALSHMGEELFAAADVDYVLLITQGTTQSYMSKMDQIAGIAAIAAGVDSPSEDEAILAIYQLPNGDVERVVALHYRRANPVWKWLDLSGKGVKMERLNEGNEVLIIPRSPVTVRS